LVAVDKVVGLKNENCIAFYLRKIKKMIGIFDFYVAAGAT
jgi:hypothetical protein